MTGLTVSSGDTVWVNGTYVLTTVGSVTVNGVVTGTGTVYYNGPVSSGNTIVQSIVYGGGDQSTISGTYSASSIAFGGSGVKSHGNATLNGDVTIEAGVNVQGNGSTLTVNGDMTNNGTTSSYPNASTIILYGDVWNYGIWNQTSTYASDSGAIGGSSAYGSNFYVNGKRWISGKVTIGLLTVQDGGKLISGAQDTLVTTSTTQTVGTGEVTGTGAVIYGGGDQTISGNYIKGKVFSLNIC